MTTASKTTKPKTVMTPQKTTWTKPGWKSTEFAGVVIVTLLQLSKYFTIPAWAAPIMWGLYAMSRGLAKSGGPEIVE